MTASEEMTLEEEHDMQQTWHDDPTSILTASPAALLHRVTDPFSGRVHLSSSWTRPSLKTTPPTHEALRNMVCLLSLIHHRFHRPTLSHPAMAGDVDLFLSEDDDGVKAAEINIMTAEERSRRKGLGREAMLLMMHYAVSTQGTLVYPPPPKGGLCRS